MQCHQICAFSRIHLKFRLIFNSISIKLQHLKKVLLGKDHINVLFLEGGYVRKTTIMKINIALTFLKSHKNDHL